MSSFPHGQAGKNFKRASAFALIASIFSAYPAQVFAQADAGDSVNLQDLQQKVLILERKLEVKDEAEQAKALTDPKFTVGPDGFVFKSPDENFQLKWKGLVQVDYRQYIDGQDTGSQRVYLSRYPNNFPSTFLLRKVRPYFEATLYKYTTFRIVPDFSGGATTLLDAYGELALWPEFKLRVGKFTAPLDLERLQSATDNFFVEYGLTSNLTRNRDLGAQISGDLFKETVNYTLGVFNGAVDGSNKDNDSTDHKDLTARVFVLPFKNGDNEWVRNLGIGFAGAWGKHWGDSANSSLPSFKSPAQNTFWTYRSGARDSLTVQAQGTYFSLIPQAYWFAGSFGLLGEYVYTSQDVGIPKKKNTHTVLESHAWEATASYVLTGEAPSYKGLKPRHALATDGSGIGAIELVARVGQLDANDNNSLPIYADSTKSASEALAFGGGINWYLNRTVKWTFDYEQTQFKGGNRLTVNDRDDEKVFTTRLQFAY